MAKSESMEKFESISNQIIEWANRLEKETDSRTLIQVIRLVFEKETDGRTLIQVIQLVFEKINDEAAWSEMYATLCRTRRTTSVNLPHGVPISKHQAPRWPPRWRWTLKAVVSHANLLVQTRTCLSNSATLNLISCISIFIVPADLQTIPYFRPIINNQMAGHR